MTFDALPATADRLVPLVNGRLDWWREAVVRWASDPPRHYVEPEPPRLIKSPELMECERTLSKQRTPSRYAGESDKHWKSRRETVGRIRKTHKQLLAKAEQLDNGCPIDDKSDWQILPVPFPALLSRDERIALLAAIYDTYIAGEKILPEFDLPLQSLDEHSVAMHYFILLSERVPALHEHWPTHHALVEIYLDEVELAITKHKRRGRKKADYKTVQYEATLAADWESARETGVRKADFAKDHGMTLEKFDKLLDRVGKRNRSYSN